jgi:hypothetical protein
MMAAMEIGKELVTLCQQEKNQEAIDKLYSPKIVSVETMAIPNMEQTQTGIEAIKGKNTWWVEKPRSAWRRGQWTLSQRKPVHCAF